MLGMCVGKCEVPHLQTASPQQTLISYPHQLKDRGLNACS